MKYTITPADRMPIPASFFEKGQGLGYSPEERAKPYAHFFEERVARKQEHVFDAIATGIRPAEYYYTIDEVAERLSKPGYERMETGIASGGRGNFMVAILTQMPGVTAEMWDWWFAWMGHESARNKLWHPEAHIACAYADDRRGRGLSWSEQYIDNASYVTEYLGGAIDNLTVRFVDPVSLGFRKEPDTLVVAGRVGFADAPILAAWGAHQIRPVDGGCEMRSRFFFGHTDIIDVPGHSIGTSGGRLLRSPFGKMAAPLLKRIIRADVAKLGMPLMMHCAEEMNHLARFLPQLFAEFRDTE